MCTKATVVIFSASVSMCVERRSSTPAAIRSLSSTRRTTPSAAGKQRGSTHKPCAASSNATMPSSPQQPERPGNHHKGDTVPFMVLFDAIARNPVLHKAEPGFFSNACFAQAVTKSYSARKSRWTAGSTLTPGPMVEDTEMDLTYLPLAEEGLTRRISVYRAA